MHFQVPADFKGYTKEITRETKIVESFNVTINPILSKGNSLYGLHLIIIIIFILILTLDRLRCSNLYTQVHNGVKRTNSTT